MQEKYSLNELKDIVKEFCQKRDWEQFHNPKDLAIAITTESSELLDLFRFKSDEEIKEMFSNYKSEKIKDELADILFFILQFSQMYNINLGESLENKIKKNNEKYPIDVSKGSNKKYNE